MNAQPSDASTRTPDGSARWLSWCLLFAIAVSTALAWSASDRSHASAPLAPPLTTAASPCAAVGSVAHAHAQELLHRARTRWERAVVDLSSARSALQDGEDALACLVDAPAALRAELTSVVAQMRAQIARDYRRLQLRLRIGRERNDTTAIRDAAVGLRTLIANDEDAYSRWLRSLEHDLGTGAQP
jgi:hypothetical protein